MTRVKHRTVTAQDGETGSSQYSLPAHSLQGFPTSDGLKYTDDSLNNMKDVDWVWFAYWFQFCQFFCILFLSLDMGQVNGA